MNFFIRNGEWNLIGFPNRRHVAYYSCCPEPYSDVTFYLIIRRRPLYHMFHLILPCIFITATTVFVFSLPAESGEKVIFISLCYVHEMVPLSYEMYSVMMIGVLLITLQELHPNAKNTWFTSLSLKVTVARDERLAICNWVNILRWVLIHIVTRCWC